MSFPTISELHPQIVQWGINKGILSADGNHKATPAAQLGKTMEEIGEAKESLGDVAFCIKRGKTQKTIQDFSRDAALELGDILVTLCLGAHLQGTTLDDCISQSPAFGSPQTWGNVNEWAYELSFQIQKLEAMYCEPEEWNDEDFSRQRTGISKRIGAVANCAIEAARVQLAMTGGECLQLALNKIWNRQGTLTADGVFVKA